MFYFNIECVKLVLKDMYLNSFAVANRSVIQDQWGNVVRASKMVVFFFGRNTDRNSLVKFRFRMEIALSAARVATEVE